MCPKLIFNLSQVEKIFFRLMFPGFSSSSSVCVYVMDNLLQDIIIFFFEKKKPNEKNKRGGENGKKCKFHFFPYIAICKPKQMRNMQMRIYDTLATVIYVVPGT